MSSGVWVACAFLLVLFFGNAHSFFNPCKEKWEIVFHAPSGNGEDVVKAWKTKHSKCDIVSGRCPCSVRRGCLPSGARMEALGISKRILRSPYVDYWNCLNIKKVRIELNTNGRTVAYMEFNGKGSNHLNWFSKGRLLKSSWRDMSKHGSFNYFTIDGARSYARNFFVNKNYGGCPNDAGWFVVKDVRGSHPCHWEKFNSYPQFLYSKYGKMTTWNKRKYGKADVLNIYIKRG